MRAIHASLSAFCSALILLSGCGGSSSDDALNYDGVLSAAELYTYKAVTNSQQLVECSVIYLASDINSCDLANVAPIGVDVFDDVTIADVSERLVVSHDWMADSFIDALEYIDDQYLLNLFKAVNTVVISYEIEVSFYHPLTASVYLAPNYLWRNTEEWDTIYQSDSSGDSSAYELQFYPIRRYIEATTSDFSTWSNSYDSEDYNARSTYAVAPGLYSLLAHELAHANDYLPPELLANLGESGLIYYDYMKGYTRIHDELNELFPLSSSLAYSAADYYYSDGEVDEVLAATTGADIGLEFEDDGAGYLYSYKADSEDIAILFEIFMMYQKYDSVYDVAFLSVPEAESPECDDYEIQWGQRNRLADSYVNERAAYIAGRIISEDYALGLAAITEETSSLAQGSGWCSSRYDTATAKSVVGRSFTAHKSPVVHNYLEDFIVEPSTPVWP